MFYPIFLSFFIIFTKNHPSFPYSSRIENNRCAEKEMFDILFFFSLGAFKIPYTHMEYGHGTV